MNLSSIHPFYARSLQDLRGWAGQKSLWQRSAQNVLREAEKLAQETGAADGARILSLLHRMSRLRNIFVANLADNGAFKAEMDKLNLPLWQKFKAPPADDILQIALADKLFAQVSHAQWNRPLVTLGDGTKLIGPHIVRKALDGGFQTIFDFDEPSRSLAIAHADEAGVRALADDYLQMVNDTNIRVYAGPSAPKKWQMTHNDENAKTYASLIAPFRKRSSTGENFFTLTTIPTSQEAKTDGLTLKELTKLHFEMVDQPWDHIDRAQLALIDELDHAKILRFTNNDGTDLTMDVDGFTFCNSLIAKNIPGSEAFSAPRRDSVEGIIVAKGLFIPPGKSGVIKNLTLEFNKGKLVRYSADEGIEHFERAISVDEGALYVGEIGIGTNPHLKRHLTNTLLVEKIGGSFHVALGQAYKMKDYLGKPVNVDNGNDSKLHWDITTMLYGKGGCIYVDGRKIMQDGLFIDPKYDVLNRGWAAVPVQERPTYWKNYKGPSV